MQSVYFHVDWQEDDETFLRNIRRQSPNESAEWGSIRAVATPEEADFHLAFNQPDARLDPDRLLLFCAEPPCTTHCGGWSEVNALETYPLSRFYKPQRWWVGQDYDTLSSMQPPKKTRPLSWITSDKGRELSPILTHLRLTLLRAGYRRFGRKPLGFLNRGPTDGHLLRMRFFDRLASTYPDLFDLYGRGGFSGPYYNGEIADKWGGLAAYRYSLAIENYRGPNYFSEKVTDALLAWCMPIYWGCTNLDEYLPADSFVEIDIEDPDAPDRIREIVRSNLREENIDAIAEARRRLLERYQIWPTVERAVQQVR